MSVAFHPDIPSIIAGGAFNGEITVWSTTDPQNPIIALSSSTALAHQEPIAKVVWIPSSTKHGQFDVGAFKNHFSNMQCFFDVIIVLIEWCHSSCPWEMMERYSYGTWTINFLNQKPCK